MATVCPQTDARCHPGRKQVFPPVVTLSDGNKLPGFGLGTYQAELGELGQVVKDALELGYRHIDTAMYYRNEAAIGAALAEVFQQGKLKREDIFVTSKLWNSFHRPELVEEACRATVSDLCLDYVDLYLMHWPIAFQVSGDDLMPRDADGNLLTEDVDITETYKAMEKCVQLGLARSIGVSNFNSEQLTRILEVATVKPVVNQVEVHPYLQQKRLIDFCSARGVVVTAFSPLGNPAKEMPGKKNVLENETLLALAQKYERSIAQVILRFLVQKGVVPIPKTVKKHRLLENISVYDFELSGEDMALIGTLDCGGRVAIMRGGQHDKNYPFHAEF